MPHAFERLASSSRNVHKNDYNDVETLYKTVFSASIEIKKDDRLI